MVYKGSTTTARILRRTKPLIEQVVTLMSKKSKGRISEAIAIDESVKLYLAKKGTKNGTKPAAPVET